MAIISQEPQVYPTFYEFIQVMKTKGRIISYFPKLLRPEEDTIIMAQINEIVDETLGCACELNESRDFRFYANIIDDKGRDMCVRVRCILVDVGDGCVQPEINDVVAMKNPFCFIPIPQEPTMQNDHKNFWFVKNVPKLDTALPYNHVCLRNDINNMIVDENDSLLNISVEELIDSEGESSNNQVVPQNNDSNVALTGTNKEITELLNIDNRIKEPDVAEAGGSKHISKVVQSSNNKDAVSDAIVQISSLENDNTASAYKTNKSLNVVTPSICLPDNKNVNSTNIPTATSGEINADASHLQNNKPTLDPGLCPNNKTIHTDISRQNTLASNNSSTLPQCRENQSTSNSNVATSDDRNSSDSELQNRGYDSQPSNKNFPSSSSMSVDSRSSEVRHASPLLLDNCTSQESFVSETCSNESMDLTIIAPHSSLITSNTSLSSVKMDDTLKLSIQYKGCYKSKKVKFYSEGTFTEETIKNLLSDNVALGYCKCCENLYNYYKMLWVTQDSVNNPCCKQCGVSQKLKIFFYCPLKLELRNDATEEKEKIELYFYSEDKNNLFGIDPIDFAKDDEVRSNFRFLVYSKVLSTGSSLIPYWLYNFEHSIIPFCFEKLE